MKRPKPTVPRLLAAVVMAIPLVFASLPAYAADPPPLPAEDGGSDNLPDTAPPTADENAKQRISTYYVAADVNGVTAALANYTAVTGSPLVNAGAMLTLTQQRAADLAAAGQGVTALSTSRWVANTLALYQVGQIKSFYCGPATAYMILKEAGKTTSAYDGASLSQTNLAKSTYLHTDAQGGTQFNYGYMEKTLNNWIFGHSAYYARLTNPNGLVFQNDLIFDIDGGYAVGTDTDEHVGGAHYNGHPNHDIRHWTASYGYLASGATVAIADPSTTVWTTGAVHPYFTYPTQSFANSFLNVHGIVW